jgi:hypothetical protein
MAKAPAPAPAPTIPQSITDNLAIIADNLRRIRADLEEIRVIAADLRGATSDAVHRYNRIAARTVEDQVTYVPNT